MIRRMLAPAVVVAAVCVGCGVQPSGVIPGLPAPTVSAYGAELYFVLDGRVTEIGWTIDAQPTPAQVLTQLIQGPNARQRGQGLTTQIPADAGPATLTSAADSGTITLPIDVTTLSTVAIDQLVCTASAALANGAQVPDAPPIGLSGGGQNIAPRHCS